MMKQLTYTSIMLLAVGFLLFPSCKKDSQVVLQDAVLTGWDARMCPCCGGLMINFDNDTTPYKAPFYLIDSMPAGTGIDWQTRFPKHVQVGWHTDTTRCAGHIVVDTMVVLP